MNDTVLGLVGLVFFFFLHVAVGLEFCAMSRGPSALTPPGGQSHGGGELSLAAGARCRVRSILPLLLGHLPPLRSSPQILR